MGLKKSLWLWLLACLPAHAIGDMGQGTPVIAAAADLQFALQEVAQRFEAETGHQVRISFGSSGQFRRQIAQGAPFQLYLSADETYVLALHAQGFTEDEGTIYALGRIVVMVPGHSVLEPDGTLQNLAAALDEQQLKKFAIANPEHAPYGVAAAEALRHAGVWDAIRPHLIYGENASQATQFALAGSADGGIVPYSLALAPPIAHRGRYDLIPEDWHNPLRQRMALIKGAGPVARAFYEYLQSPAARAIFVRYGFELPADVVADEDQAPLPATVSSLAEP